MNASVLFDHVGVTSELDRPKYERLSVILLYYLYDVTRCSTTPPSDVPSYGNYSAWMTSLGDGGPDDDIRALLSVLRKTYNNTQTGNHETEEDDAKYDVSIHEL